MRNFHSITVAMSVVGTCGTVEESLSFEELSVLPLESVVLGAMCSLYDPGEVAEVPVGLESTCEMSGDYTPNHSSIEKCEERVEHL